MSELEQRLIRLTAQWIRIAQSDFATAMQLRDLPGDFGRQVSFHAQQAIEKFAKALLVIHQIEVPFTHQITILNARISEHLNAPIDPALFEAERLTPYAVTWRYPDESEEISAEQIMESCQLATNARAVLVAQLTRSVEQRMASAPENLIPKWREVLDTLQQLTA